MRSTHQFTNAMREKRAQPQEPTVLTAHMTLSDGLARPRASFFLFFCVFLRFFAAMRSFPKAFARLRKPKRPMPSFTFQRSRTKVNKSTRLHVWSPGFSRWAELRSTTSNYPKELQTIPSK